MPEIVRREWQLLLIEDSEADAHLVRLALEQTEKPVCVNVAEDGLEGLDFIHRRGRHRHAPRPDLILLDLNLPKRDGHSVLREVKADPALREIPVVIYTSSGAREDVQGAYGAHANCYVRKPRNLDDFLEVVQKIESFWTSTATLPDSPLMSHDVI